MKLNVIGRLLSWKMSPDSEGRPTIHARFTFDNGASLCDLPLPREAVEELLKFDSIMAPVAMDIRIGDQAIPTANLACSKPVVTVQDRDGFFWQQECQTVCIMQKSPNFVEIQAIT